MGLYGRIIGLTGGERRERDPHGELGWLRALPHKDGGPGFEPPGGTGDLPGCSTPGPRGISRGARKLARTSTVIKKKKKKKEREGGREVGELGKVTIWWLACQLHHPHEMKVWVYHVSYMRKKLRLSHGVPTHIITPNKNRHFIEGPPTSYSFLPFPLFLLIMLGFVQVNLRVSQIISKVPKINDQIKLLMIMRKLELVIIR